jgi:hypothetical protein
MDSFRLEISSASPIDADLRAGARDAHGPCFLVPGFATTSDCRR